MHPFLRPLRLLGVALALTLIWTGCDSNDDADPDPTPTVQTFTGTMASGSESGSLSLTIDGTDVTGTYSLADAGNRGGTYPPLTGTYDPDTGTVTMSGGGFSFTGTISGSTFSGTYTNPDGSTGTFTTYLEGSSDEDEVRVYCGTYDTAQDDGTLNLIVRGTDLLGVAVAYGDDDPTGLRGRVNGVDITVWLEEGSEAQPVANGTFAADFSTAQGTIAAADGNTGSWQIGPCN